MRAGGRANLSARAAIGVHSPGSGHGTYSSFVWEATTIGRGLGSPCLGRPRGWESYGLGRPVVDITTVTGENPSSSSPSRQHPQLQWIAFFPQLGPSFSESCAWKHFAVTSIKQSTVDMLLDKSRIMSMQKRLINSTPLPRWSMHHHRPEWPCDIVGKPRAWSCAISWFSALTCLFEFWHLDSILLCSILCPPQRSAFTLISQDNEWFCCWHGNGAFATDRVLRAPPSCRSGRAPVPDEAIYLADEVGKMWPLDQEGNAWPAWLEGLDFCILGSINSFPLALAA